MKRLVHPGPSLALLFLTMLFTAAGTAQEPAKTMLPLQAAPDMPAPNPKGTDPKPEPAEAALLAAFDNHEVVGMSAAHGNKDLDDFILHLLRNPTFRIFHKERRTTLVSIECGCACQPLST